MNIFGEGFPTEILNQIKHRQRVYGSGYNSSLRSNEQILYLNGNSSWCKLVSGVDVSNISALNNPTIKNLGLSGNDLAQKFVLFNGTFDTTDGEQKSGISPVNNVTGYNYAYGIGGNNFGIRPMMGIQSANIKHENRGSLRRAEVKIKAFNRAQFEIIDILYARLGFTVLLEWGHSIIINNAGSIDTTPTGMSLANTFLSGKDTYDELLQKIYDQRLKFGGNYDAMLGKVANFSWSLLPDGTYDITIYLSSIGDVIESLKVNILTDSVSNSGAPPATPPTTGSGDIIDNFAYQSTLGNFFYVCKNLVDDPGLAIDISIDPNVAIYKAVSLNPNFGSSNISNFISSNPNFIKFNNTEFDMEMDDIISAFAVGSGNSFSSYLSSYLGATTPNKLYYIRLGTFLKFLEKYIVASVYNSSNTKTPLLFFDTDTDTNIMGLCFDQVSLDPRICLLNTPVYFVNGSSYVFGSSKCKNLMHHDELNSGIKNREVHYCKLMNIYLEMGFVLNKIFENKDDKNNLVLIDFLKSLMYGINEALGGINDFDIFVDETNNTVRIIDKNPLPSLENVIKILNSNFTYSRNNSKKINAIPSSPTFDLVGYMPNSPADAGFIKEFSLTSQISSQFSTMITAGAAARGMVVGENDTALTKLNRGLSDRYKPAIVNAVNPDPPGSANALSKLEQEYKNMYNPYVGFLNILKDLKATSTDVETFKPTYSSLVQKRIELDKTKDIINNSSGSGENYQGTGFIPFNLSLGMDGLSGIKINQQFTMDTTYLPSNYPESMLFLIKNLSHNIQNNKWTTKIETYAIGKPDVTKSKPARTANTSTPPSSGTPTPFVTSSVPIVSGSDLRKAIVQQAYAYYNQNIVAINGRRSFTSNGTPNTSFFNEIKGVGFSPGAHWCQFFSNLVWKKAYAKVGASNPNIANIATTKLKNFRAGNPLNGYCPAVLANMKKLGAGEDFQIKVTKLYPGDMIMLDNAGTVLQDHVQIVVEADNTTRTFRTIGGNEGISAVKLSPPRSMDKNTSSGYGRITGVVRPIE